MRFAKKDSGLRSVTYKQALECAICYGWIDGQKRSESETTWLQKFVPRGKRSTWSKRIGKTNAVSGGVVEALGAVVVAVGLVERWQEG